jgi:ABC-type hemin transport system ATPase subunit
LSGGEKKILGILRVKAKLLQNQGEVKIVLLDEPMANLSFKSNSESASETVELSIHDWMQKLILSMMRDYPLVTFIYIDHSGVQKNSLSAQIKAETGLSKRSKVLILA